MVLLQKKWKTTDEDFEIRKEKAIQQIKDKEFISTPRIKYRFTEQQIRETFEFEDIDKLYYKFDNVYFDGNFVFFPEDKTIWV